MVEGTKVCLRCEQALPVAQFSRHRSRPDGLQAYCRACTSAANARSVARNKARRVIDVPERKRCPRCDATKVADEFHTDRRRHDGLYVNCRQCHRAITDAWKAVHHPDVSRHRRASYRRHAEKRRREAREYSEAHVEEARAKDRAWKRANRARATALEAIRRARKVNAVGDATPEQIAARVDFYGGRCWMCGDQWEHIDHVKPLSKGGSNWPANLRPACATCNLTKGDRWPWPSEAPAEHVLAVPHASPDDRPGRPSRNPRRPAGRPVRGGDGPPDPC